VFPRYFVFGLFIFNIKANKVKVKVTPTVPLESQNISRFMAVLTHNLATRWWNAALCVNVIVRCNVL
jgi:hypothetical protein